MFELEQFRSAVDRLHSLVEDTDDAIVGMRPSAAAWTLKEILGHLIDSASNNHQRFVRLQEGVLEGFPAYDGERWVRIQRYNEMSWQLLKELWLNYNRLILGLIETMPASCLGNTWTVDGEARSLEWLVNDYYRHLKWHFDHYESRAAEISG